MRKIIFNKFSILILICILINFTIGNDSDDDNVRKSTVTDNEFSNKVIPMMPVNKGATIIDNENQQYECGSPENFHVGHFTLYDYSVVIGMLVISLGIGVFYGFFNKTIESESSADFLHGSQMSLFPVSLSLTTSFITAIELLGNPSEMFYHGTQFSLIVLSILFVIPCAIKIFYPIYFKLQLTSCYEYLGIRFGKDIRVFGAILYILQMSFYTAVSVYAPAIALSKATGLNTRLAIFLIYVVCVFYSSQGGMKAVVIADTFQACVLALSLIVICVLGTLYTGNITEIFQVAEQNDRLEFLNVDPNPTTRHTIFSVIIGGFFYWTSLLCTNQASVQKCMSLKSQTKANLAIIFSIIGLIIVFVINFYTGLMLFKHYTDCDPLKSGEISGKDELLPFYIMDVLANLHFVNGLFVAGIFAASLGTVASALNSLSAVTSEDILITALNIKIDPSKGATYGKWMSLGYGLLSFTLIFLVEQLGGILQATLTLNGLIGGVTLGLFSLGIFFKCSNAKGALYGGLIALVTVVFIGVMAQITDVDPVKLPTALDTCDCYVNTTSIFNSLLNDVELSMKTTIATTTTTTGFLNASIFKISYMWYSFLGCILTILFGLLISVTTDKISENTILTITTKNSSSIEKSMKSNGFDEKSSNKNSDVIFMVERYRKKSYQHFHPHQKQEQQQQQQQQQQQKQEHQQQNKQQTYQNHKLDGIDNAALNYDEF